MVSELMSSLAQVSWLPSFFLIVAILFFAAIIVWVCRLDKSVVSEIERLPLDSSDTGRRGGDEAHG